MKIRTRYAPSPTGYLHIGGARTALFCFLFAKKNNGDFIIRIEDTDTKRNVKDGEKSQIENLEWLGVVADESPLKPNPKYNFYRQSEKFKKYEMLAYKLVEEKKAYYCFCSAEELMSNESNKYSKKCLFLTPEEIEENLKNNIDKVIRIKTPSDSDYSWNDLIRGNVTINSSSMSDIVILKSNSIPTYNFAVVVDDYDMDITHVLRGEEHISNTPYQMHIKNILGFSRDIEYGHLPIIVNKDGKKLSKRDDSVKQFIEDYKNLGYPASGITNYLSLLGWTPGDNNEIFNLSSTIEKFDISRVSKSPSQFDTQKLEWVCQEKIKAESNEDYLINASKFINFSHEKKEDVLLLMKDQVSNYSQINDLSSIFIEEDIKLSYDNLNTILPSDQINNFCTPMLNHLDILEEWNRENIKIAINNIKSETQKKGKDLFMPIRYISSRRMHGPDLVSVLYILGKNKVLSRIKEVLNENN